MPPNDVDIISNSKDPDQADMFKILGPLRHVLLLNYFVCFRYHEFKNLKKSERKVCMDCGLLLLPGEINAHEGQGHVIKESVTKQLLRRPTELFTPLDNNKTYAVSPVLSL